MASNDSSPVHILGGIAYTSSKISGQTIYLPHPCQTPPLQFNPSKTNNLPDSHAWGIQGSVLYKNNNVFRLR